MSDNQSTGSALRRALLPRLFSRSETGGVLEKILRSLRQTNPRADVAMFNNAAPEPETAVTASMYGSAIRTTAPRCRSASSPSFKV